MVRAGGAGQLWRASLEDTLTGQRRDFAGIEALAMACSDRTVSIFCHKNILAIAELVSWRPEEDYHETQETATGNVQRPADSRAAGRLRVAGCCAGGHASAPHGDARTTGADAGSAHPRAAHAGAVNRRDGRNHRCS
jgi:hypothetical protein